MRKLLALVVVLFLAVVARAQDRVVVQIDVEGPITPVVAGYVERSIAAATEEGVDLLLIRLDTPGGAVDVTSRISQTMNASHVPIVVWVAPTGAMAASAGTFLVLSGHKAAMAPGTFLGAASPVGGRGEELGETMKAKAKNVLAAQIRSLASRRGEKAQEWAERAVHDAAAATAQEALEMGVIDVVASDREELLAKLDGADVTVLNADFIKLQLRGATVREEPMTAIESFLQTIANPTIAFLLLMIGLNAILFELSSPGGYVAGAIGVICLLMGWYSLGVLPVNYAGLLLIAVAFALFVIDVKVSTHGVLTVGGVVALVFGAMVLFDSPSFAVWRPAIVAVAIATGLFFAFIVAAAVRTGRRRPVTGREGLVGARGTSRTPLDPVGMVMVEGELWRARSDAGPVAAGVPVEVAALDGMELLVRRC